MFKNEEQTFTSIHELAAKRAEYREYEESTKQLGRKIMNILGSNRDLFLEFEKLIYLTQGICLESAYEIGLNDGQDK